jgi:hypothetical protein
MEKLLLMTSYTKIIPKEVLSSHVVFEAGTKHQASPVFTVLSLVRIGA